MSHRYIEIKGARTNNLKDVNVKIPLGQITCIMGASGSGKTSLAHQTLYAESKRRFLNSLPNSFRFFSEKPAPSDVDSIFPILPVWSLPQNNPILSSRQNVLDLIEGTHSVLDLFSSCGEVHCPTHKVPLEKVGFGPQISRFLKKCPAKAKAIHVFVSKDAYAENFESGPIPTRSVKAKSSEVQSFDSGDNYFELFRVRSTQAEKIEEKINELELKNVKSYLLKFDHGKSFSELIDSKSYKCPHCDYISESRFTPRSLLTPFNGLGACSSCKGYGTIYIYDRAKMIKEPWKTIREGAVTILQSAHFDYYEPIFKSEIQKIGLSIDVPFSDLPEKKWKFLYEGGGKFPGLNAFFDYLERKRYKKTIRIFTKRIQTEVLCPVCEGARITKENHSYGVRTTKENIFYKDSLLLTISDAIKKFEEAKKEHNFKNKQFLKFMNSLKICENLGLGYLQFNRKVKSLTASEYQRLLLVKYFSFQGTGSLFILDEPSLGLRVEEQKKIYYYLERLKALGNTVLLVDHSEFLQSKVDYRIEMGPGAGIHGGEILYQGKNKDATKSTRAKKLSKKSIKPAKALKFEKVHFWNKTCPDLSVPLGELTHISGPPGVGKTSLFIKTLANAHAKLNQEEKVYDGDLRYKKIHNLEKFKSVYTIDASALHSNSRSTVGTYLEISPVVRNYYANLFHSQKMGLEKGHFSPNSAKGRCSTCEGRGFLEAEMKYFESVRYTCPDCEGHKLNPLYANITDGKYKFKEIVKVPLSEIWDIIVTSPKFVIVKELLEKFHLDYLNLGRPLTSLSGGERQRLKLAKLFLKSHKESLFVIENLSFGLSSLELLSIGNYLRQLTEMDNTILVIDPNQKVSKFSHNSLELKESQGSKIRSELKENK
ncbi:MAG: ATP-binding cassette domain-containing protein [Bacteriovoracaceae bacterium]